MFGCQVKVSEAGWFTQCAIVVVGSLLAGCVPEPITYRVRLRPEIERVSERILSLQLVGPAAVGEPRVICRGVFTPRYLEGSDDTLQEFEVGYIDPMGWKRNRVRLLLQEGGESCLIPLDPPPVPMLDHIYYLRARVPLSLDEANVQWTAKQRAGQPITDGD